MRRTTTAASPDAYVAALAGWRRDCVEALRATVRAASTFDEVIKWNHLVYCAKGPVLLIRAEERRVLVGFWRGQRLRMIEPRLKPGGKYEMATLEIREGMIVDSATVGRLAAEAASLDRTLGDPTKETPQKKAQPGPRYPAMRFSAGSPAPNRRIGPSSTFYTGETRRQYRPCDFGPIGRGPATPTGPNDE